VGRVLLARLRSLRAEELRERHARGIQDRWEHRSLEYVLFRPGEVIEYLLDDARVTRWAPVVPVVFWLALAHVYGRGEVERTARRVVEARTEEAGKARAR